MKILLDTCTFLWVISSDPKLSKNAKAFFLNSDNEPYLSSVSTWEISLKYSIGRLMLPVRPDVFVPEQRALHGVESLPLDEDSTLYLRRLPELHNDPFDRMLICQSIVHGLVIMTPDDMISRYPVRTVW